MDANLAKLRLVVFGLLAVFALIAAGCGDDDTDAGSGESDGGPTQNACPSDGCVVTIADVTADGEELTLTFEANFLPDFSQNHLHVYWDTFDVAQVSADAATVHNVEQGVWDPTGAYPTYTTQNVVALAERGDSTVLCVSAADLTHNILDTSLFDCFDVSDLV